MEPCDECLHERSSIQLIEPFVIVGIQKSLGRLRLRWKPQPMEIGSIAGSLKKIVFADAEAGFGRFGDIFQSEPFRNSELKHDLIFRSNDVLEKLIVRKTIMDLECAAVDLMSRTNKLGRGPKSNFAPDHSL